MSRSIRIGIDVGGTFTHAVAIDGLSLELIGKVKVPTTHTSEAGVATGIIEALNLLLSKEGIRAEDVRFIAHSTTQATNALLEGDVAPVGVLGLGGGAGAFLARLATNIGPVALSPGKKLAVYHRFVDTTKAPDRATIQAALTGLWQEGARAIAISAAFSVDEPQLELIALEIARDMKMPATCGSEVSQLYGLKIRTRTAVVNAAMLPKMMQTADMTEKAVRQAGIQAPIMIMRSDGGVMDIEAMRRRPILTMLSGPAAGVAAAMMYLNISDGIFLEVGGTSTDISAIRNGKALVKPAEVGGHRLYIHTLDVRTVGVAGGSIPRLSGSSLVDVGPRSAHIAGLKYAAFSDTDAAKLKTIKPLPADPSDYVAFSSDGETPLLCLTPTCAANFLELVPARDPAEGSGRAIELCMSSLAKRLGKDERHAAQDILTLAAARCQRVVGALMKDYGFDKEMVSLYGGGGGAAAIVPFLAGQLKMRHMLAHNADVISAIGVALALVRETVERSVINPGNEDILKVREEARSSVQKMGADPSSIEVHVEVDRRNNIIRATAFGATELKTDLKRAPLSKEEQRALAAESMKVSAETVTLVAETDHHLVYAAETWERKLAGLLPVRRHSLRTMDRNGVIRLQTRNGVARQIKANDAEKAIADLAEDLAEYGDAGRVIPNFMLLAAGRIVDLSGLLDLQMVLSVARIELESLPRDAAVIVIASSR